MKTEKTEMIMKYFDVTYKVAKQYEIILKDKQLRQIKPRDIIVAINGSQITNLESFYKKIWNSGEAGVTIELSVLRSGSLMNFKVITVDRLDFFFKPQSF